MPRLARLGIAMLVIGAGLLVAGTVTGARRDRVFRVGMTGSSVKIDPQVAYVTTAWWLEYATAAKLFNYPDKPAPAGARVVREAAARYAVSDHGRTYTFWIRKGFRFSDGTPVTARSFAYAIDRALSPGLGAPAADLVTDPTGTNIVGAQRVRDGEATHARGVKARGRRLTIRLVTPDASLPVKLALPFFQATSTRLPLTREVNVGYPSAGPYYFSRNDVDRLTSIRRNPYWHRGPGRQRPRHLGGLDVRWGVDEQIAYVQVTRGELDAGPLPAARVVPVAQRFGVNKSRFWVEPTSCTSYMPFNSSRPLFHRNPALRRAISWAIDRKKLLGDDYRRSAWTHMLSPLTSGSILAQKKQPYSPRSNIQKARKLAKGHLRNGRIVVIYRSSGAEPDDWVELLRSELVAIGFDPKKIELKGFTGGGIYDAMATSAGWDFALGPIGWCTDFPDGRASLDILTGPVPWALDDPAYASKLATADKLTGRPRERAFGKLDLEITRKLAPIVVVGFWNNLFFVGPRVDVRSLVYQPIYADWSIPALRLK